MWLLHAKTRKLHAFQGSQIPRYAILSHRWEDEEVSFKDLMKRSPGQMKGYYKIDMCCKEAITVGLDYVWVDTCCIDRRSSAELSEAINSMYKWYQKADICYAYLYDVSMNPEDGLPFSTSTWFSRGWTLQELLAPFQLQFFDRAWNSLGYKYQPEMLQSINQITRIPRTALARFVASEYCIAERMHWASSRETTREEDTAYCLLGIFGINMPLLYGEGTRAFYRLQEEIIKVSSDCSIFLWSGESTDELCMFAASPAEFKNSGGTGHHSIGVSFLPELLHGKVVSRRFGISNVGLDIQLYLQPLCPGIFVAYLGDAFVNDQLQFFVMFLEKVQKRPDSDMFRRVSVNGLCWQILSIEDLNPTERYTVLWNTVLDRIPLIRSWPLPSFEIRCRSSYLSCVYSQEKSKILKARQHGDSDHTQKDKRTLSVPMEHACGIVCAFYEINRLSQLVLLVVGLDHDSSPICFLDVWPVHLSKKAMAWFSLTATDNGTEVLVPTGKQKPQLLRVFENAMDLPGAEKVEGSSLTAFRGKSRRHFVQSGVAFIFNMHRHELFIEMNHQNQPSAAKDLNHGVDIRHWPFEHTLMYPNYFDNLIMELSE